MTRRRTRSRENWRRVPEKFRRRVLIFAAIVRRFARSRRWTRWNDRRSRASRRRARPFARDGSRRNSPTRFESSTTRATIRRIRGGSPRASASSASGTKKATRTRRWWNTWWETCFFRKRSGRLEDGGSNPRGGGDARRAERRPREPPRLVREALGISRDTRGVDRSHIHSTRRHSTRARRTSRRWRAASPITLCETRDASRRTTLGAPNGDDGRAGALVVGACVAGVLRVAAQMSRRKRNRRRSTSRLLFSPIAPPRRSRTSGPRRCGRAEDAYAEAAAEYEGGVHLLDFSEESPRMVEDPPPRGARRLVRRTSGGIRAATVLADAAARGRRAIRRLANRIADRTVREVALCAAFSRGRREIRARRGRRRRRVRRVPARRASSPPPSGRRAPRARRGARGGVHHRAGSSRETRGGDGDEGERGGGDGFAEADGGGRVARKLGFKPRRRTRTHILSRRTDMGASAER